jgi:ATP-binding cassette subfamily B multidrug efflux pump
VPGKVERAVEDNESTLPDLKLREIFHIIGQSIREYKKPSIATPILVIGEVAIECIIPFYTSQMLDAINEGASMEVVTRYGLMLVLLALVSLAFGTSAGVTASYASTGLAKNLRHDMFQSIQSFSFSNIDHFSTSSLVTRLTTDATNVQNAYMQLIRTAIRSPLLCLFAIVMAYVTAGPMALFYALVALVLAFVIFGIAAHVMPMFRRLFRRYDQLNDSVKENIDGIRDVKSYVREDFEKKKFEKASGSLRDDFVHIERIIAWNTPVMTLCIDVVYLYVVYFGSKAIVTSQGTLLQVGQMSALITYGFSMLISLMMLSMVFVQITMSEEGARRICQVLIERPDIAEPAHPVTEMADGSIDFDHVTFAYEDRLEQPALQDIDLHIKSGETVGIIGGTGSSKSSLVQLISRLYDVSEGSVRVGGVDVRDYDLKALRDQVAVVLQRNQLFSGTIKENLRWGNPDATDEELVEACKLAQADDFIRLFPDGYDTYITQGGTNISGGQKQRLCIARALLKHPKVLILDDSTSAVDTKTDKLIRMGLASYIPSTTKLIIAQRTSSVQEADRIVVMDHGRIDAVDTPDNLLRTNEIYRDIYLTQNKESHDQHMSELEAAGRSGRDEAQEGEANADE